MATIFTQDAVLHFLQNHGGSVKNSDLLLHFRIFIRNHADQDRNRELFKKYVNSVATVKQQEGVSYVVLRKKFRGHIQDDVGEVFNMTARLSAPQSSESGRTGRTEDLGADLDQLLQEEARGGSEAARLNRLHLISSSLSLPYNLSSSSLSSCSTPPQYCSLADLDDEKGGRRIITAVTSSTTHYEESGRQLMLVPWQSLVPLEPREHSWLVKGAAGAWTDVYSLFREDSSLLNKHDFISGFTVLHWIAKHGDHRVLNTLWYAGLMFDINARSTCGHTPLHIAAIHGNKNIMRLLVNKFNADVRLRDMAGKKPWQYLNYHMPVDILQLLGAPTRAPVGGVRRVDVSWENQQHQQCKQRNRRQLHHFSSTSSGESRLTIAGTTKVKRSLSIAAFLKRKPVNQFHGDQFEP
uniref:SOWAHA-C winged helix-turn-helix domain-containing protein n=1 Tax=Echeneis naucrates TaxID=173247 RepID=A0A665TA84_ECHNA